MNNDHDIFISLKNDPALRLSDAERSAMRTTLLELTRRAREDTSSVPTALPSPYFSFFARPYALIAAVLVIALISGGTVGAAEGALPGDTLYAVKVHVNENVERTFALTDTAKAEVEIRHVEERFKEIELLAVKGEEERASVAAEDAKERIANAKEKLKRLKEPQEPEATLAYAISAHTDILFAQAEGNEGRFGRSVAQLAHLSFEDAPQDASGEREAQRVRALIAKAQEKLADKDIAPEARGALSEELTRIASATRDAEESGDVRALIALSREAYRALAVAQTAERIAATTGHTAFVRFSDEDEDTAASPPMETGTAAMMMTLSAEDTATSIEERVQEEEVSDDERPRLFERKLEFRIFERSEKEEEN